MDNIVFPIDVEGIAFTNRTHKSHTNLQPGGQWAKP
jgi:hypothetical protein